MGVENGAAYPVGNMAHDVFFGFGKKKHKGCFVLVPHDVGFTFLSFQNMCYMQEQTAGYISEWCNCRS